MTDDYDVRLCHPTSLMDGKEWKKVREKMGGREEGK